MKLEEETLQAFGELFLGLAGVVGTQGSPTSRKLFEGLRPHFSNGSLSSDGVKYLAEQIEKDNTIACAYAQYREGFEK